MPQTIVPYSPEYAARKSASTVGGAFGYGGPVVPYSPTSSGYNAAAGAAQAGTLPTVYREATGSDSGVLSAMTQASDPYAQWGGKSAYDSARAGFGTQRQNILSGANEAIGNAARGYGSSILDFLDSLRSGQRNIDQQSIQNELGRQQGTRGVLDMVGRGIKSGGVMLANRNAADSSAAGALAGAYGDMGRRQLSQVGNEYAMNQNELGQQQEDLSLQQSQGLRHLNESKTQVVNGIVSQARNALAALDAAIAGASLPDRIQIEAEKETIRQQALQQLQQYDSQLSQGVAGIRPMDQNQARTQANQLAMAGAAPAESFNFSTETPAQFQNTGPYPSGLPLFQLPRNRRQG